MYIPQRANNVLNLSQSSARFLKNYTTDPKLNFFKIKKSKTNIHQSIWTKFIPA